MAVAEEITAIRHVLKIEEEFSTIPDRVRDFYFNDEWVQNLAKSLEALVPQELRSDPAFMERARLELEYVMSEQFFQAWFDSAKLALAALASSPESIEFHQRFGFDLEDHLRTLHQYIPIALQADRLRRKYGISGRWPAEMAILYGTRYVPEPFAGPLPKRMQRESLHSQFSQSLFGSTALPFDDRRQVQYARDMGNAAFERLLPKIRAKLENSETTGPTQRKTDTSREFAELFIYKRVQEKLPKYLRQPLPETPFPHRVMKQRQIDARHRLAKIAFGNRMLARLPQRKRRKPKK